jgi:hypothetical protein
MSLSLRISNHRVYGQTEVGPLVELVIIVKNHMTTVSDCCKPKPVRPGLCTRLSVLGDCVLAGGF